VIAVGNDYRDYSLAIKNALILGLMQAGIQVKDIGPALSPMAYFAQFHLDVPAVAMVTASHNPNGWTGVKMGFERPLTHGPDEMAELRDIVLNGAGRAAPGGGYEFVDGVREAYLDDLVGDFKMTRKLKVVCATGNGTAGAFRARGAVRADGGRGRAQPQRARLHLPQLQPQPRGDGDAARHGRP
jgi:phosphomannomutase/phosphoglucomutase